MEENKTAPVKKAYKRTPRKKVCVFCQEKIEVIRSEERRVGKECM